MANEVFFKRGLAANLPTQAANITDGAFYLTTDTDRLYVGQTKNGVKTLVELNKSITVVSTIADLPSTGVAAGQFYYVSTPNVLCEYNGSTWVQINPDTTLSAENGTNISVSTVSNGATVTDTITDSKNNVSSGNFTIKGDSNLNVTVSGNEITLAPNIANITSATNTTYTVATAAHSGGGADIQLISSDTTPVVDSVGVVGSGAASVTQANDVITISVDQPVATTEAEFDSNGNLTTTVSVNNQTYVNTDATVVPTIKLGTNATEYKFVADANDTHKGVATLPVYTKTETDNKISDALGAANAMTYKGTVSSSDASTKLASTGNVGDTYKASGAIPAGTPSGFPGAKTGDLIIAEGTDGAVTWSVVPSGDDQTITGAVDALSIEIDDQAGELAGATFAAGTHMSVTGTADGTSDTHTTITIAQAQDYTAQTVSGSSSAVTQASAGATATQVTYVTGIQTDAYGNVVNNSITTQTLTLTDTHNRLSDLEATVTSSGNVSTITIDANDTDGSTITGATFSIGSNNLTITDDTNGNITANLEWGSF